MTLSELDLSAVRFRTSEAVLPELRAACDANPDLAEFEIIGESEGGRPIVGVRLGIGPRVATLVAGAHADEPVGPETLRALVLEGLAARDWGAEGGGLEDLLQRWTLRIIPHVNPDAEARNRPWIDAWDAPPDPHGEGRDLARLRAFLLGRRREPPGGDVEFGYSGRLGDADLAPLRVENATAEAFLFAGRPPSVHLSLHGMGYSEGALLLVSEGWLDARTELLRAGFLDAAAAIGLRPHDHDRQGDKGFVYAGPGAWSTPRGAAMRDHFLALGDAETAGRFHLSSMERASAAARAAGAPEPLSVVTELPLFVVSGDAVPEPCVATELARFNPVKDALLDAAADGAPLAPILDAAGVRIATVELRGAIGVQLRAVEMALDAANA